MGFSNKILKIYFLKKLGIQIIVNYFEFFYKKVLSVMHDIDEKEKQSIFWSCLNSLNQAYPTNY